MTTTLPQLLTTYSPSECMRSLSNCNTVSKAIQPNTHSLSAMVRDHGIQKIEAYIKIWLIDLNESLDLRRPLKPSQIDQITFFVVSKHRNFNIADINLIFTNAKTGKYGEFYESLSMAKVLSWFNEYSESRSDAAGELSYQNHVQSKTAFSNVSRSCDNTLREKMKGIGNSHKKHNELKETKDRKEREKENYKKIKNNDKD